MTPGEEIKIVRHTRGHVILEHADGLFRVDGEGLVDGSWVIYGAVTRVDPSDFDRGSDQEVSTEIGETVLSALRNHWDSVGFDYKVNPP